MDEERFNRELRKFLKRFGVTTQREIERAVRAAIDSGVIGGEETLAVEATVTVPGVLPALRIEGQIALSGPETPDAA
ncbi:MAG: hypothetical protein MNPFHGCM_01934 [Gemmatimonadaceae bacterium]|nr:hypothetical protein [Gemmatimonadaceae bacterium]